jgi:4'-phosphopantetheinyl transferase
MPPDLELAAGDVHIVCASLDLAPSNLDYFVHILSKEEHARADRFKKTVDRNRFLARRGLLREILGRLLRANPAELTFTYGTHGKPRLAAPFEARSLQFNLSHSDGIAVFILATHGAVGIDVERIRPISEAETINAHFFTASEHSEWRWLPAARRLDAFFGRWTCAEALVKAAGGSIASPPKQFGLLPSDHNSRLQCGSVQTSLGVSAFSLFRLTPVCGYQAAAAFEGDCVPKCWGWPTE